MGMTFTDIENKSAKRLIGIAAVIFLHLLVAYILMSGLANNIQKPAEKPVELQIIQDIKPPPPPKPEEPKLKEKPPEPPKMVEKVAKVPEPPKEVEKVATPVQKTTPVAQPTKVATPAPAAPSTPSPSPVAAPAPVAAAAPAPKPAGVTRGVSEGSAGCEKPEYPREALMNEEQGTVRIRVLVDTSGKVIDAKVKKSSGSKILDKAATKAYSLCTFKPAMKDGVPQQDWYEIEYPFVIE
ncbi:energy transducer TonB [Acinetobacter baumannii]|uniref:energy transducer TonB n=1 Tax=Acinetobacter baumannii TaxID=470 RepID=UPI00214844B2|nr:energy transducer TonB [Acinetobacter baumannii]MCR0006138.1 energy transducer TonB [Acinetobacter baumannii]MDC5138796.1 energy transducer TonB [Acinetobacter baumannii]MDC5519217.1 energy transducer TonB [Acinetobacter baumannii]HAV3580470.1 energy transducer TonB [Acinetobacter baumannii]HCQ9879923.1 energy transducer TonB [Acinetobacter baumannii]